MNLFGISISVRKTVVAPDLTGFDPKTMEYLIEYEIIEVREGYPSAVVKIIRCAKSPAATVAYQVGQNYNWDFARNNGNAFRVGDIVRQTSDIRTYAIEYKVIGNNIPFDPKTMSSWIDGECIGIDDPKVGQSPDMTMYKVHFKEQRWGVTEQQKTILAHIGHWIIPSALGFAPGDIVRWIVASTNSLENSTRYVIVKRAEKV